MDKLTIVKAVFEEQFSNSTRRLNNTKDESGVLGYGIGYNSPKAVKACKNESYSIVMIIDADLPDVQLKSMPKKIEVNKEDIPQLANKKGVPKKIEVKVRYERKKLYELDLLNKDSSLIINRLSANIKGGDPVFFNGGWIGTGGYIFQFQNLPHIASNKHVFDVARENGLITNINGQTIAQVTFLSSRTDSALAKLEPSILFSKYIPGIGVPSTITGAIDLNLDCKKRGAATDITEFRINWVGVIDGVKAAKASNIIGKNIPVVGKGDSGSIVIGKNNNILALVFKGSTIVGTGLGGPLFSEIWMIDIFDAFSGISL